MASLGPGTTLLVDTYDVTEGVRTAVEVAGTSLGAVRLDSGDLLEQARQVRAQLDGLGATGTRIVVTSDLDEYAIAALAVGSGRRVRGRHPAGDRFRRTRRRAWSTSSSRAPTTTASCGRSRSAARRRPRWVAASGRCAGGPRTGSRRPRSSASRNGRRDDGDDRALMVDLVRDGELLSPPDLGAARGRHLASRAELPASALRLQRGEVAIPTVFEDRAAP